MTKDYLSYFDLRHYTPQFNPIISGTVELELELYFCPDSVFTRNLVCGYNTDNTAFISYSENNVKKTAPCYIFAVKLNLRLADGLIKYYNITKLCSSKTYTSVTSNDAFGNLQLKIPDLSSVPNAETAYKTFSIDISESSYGVIFNVPESYKLCYFKEKDGFSPFYLNHSFMKTSASAGCNFKDSSFDSIKQMILSLQSDIGSLSGTIGSLSGDISSFDGQLSAINSITSSITENVNACTIATTTSIEDLINSKCGGGSGGDCDLTQTNKLIVDCKNDIEDYIDSKCSGISPVPPSPITDGIIIPQSSSYSLFGVGTKVSCGELGSDWTVVGYSPLFVGRDVLEHLYVLSKNGQQISSPAKFISAVVSK